MGVLDHELNKLRLTWNNLESLIQELQLLNKNRVTYHIVSGRNERMSKLKQYSYTLSVTNYSITPVQRRINRDYSLLCCQKHSNKLNVWYLPFICTEQQINNQDIRYTIVLFLI